MPQRKVFLATPAYDSNIHACCVSSLLAGTQILANHGYLVTWQAHLGGCYLPVVRNKLVRSFLESGFTDLIFVDADLEFDPVGLLKLLAFDKDIIGGTYPYKTDEGGFPVRLITDETGQPIIDAITGLVAVDGLPTGFLRIRRNVFDSMLAHYGEEALTVRERRSDGSLRETYLNFFDTSKDGDLWWGEDYYFCNRWKAMGGEMWLCPDITFGHHGLKQFQGNFWQSCGGDKHVNQ